MAAMKVHAKTILKSGIIGVLFMLNIHGTTGWFHARTKVVEEPEKAREISKIKLADFLMLAQSSNVLIIDMRPSEAIAHGKIPNAVEVNCVDFNDLPSETKNILAYGNRKNASEAQRQLNSLQERTSIPIAYYDGGWEEWLSCKLPIEKAGEVQ